MNQRRPTKPPQPTAAQLGIRAGDRVTRLGDGGEVTEHTATSDPWQSYEGGPWLIKLSGIAGGWILTRVDKVAAAPAPAQPPQRFSSPTILEDVCAAIDCDNKPIPQPPPAPCGSAKWHTFTHLARNGVTMSLTVDLSGNAVAIQTSHNAKDHPELWSEYSAWADSIATQIVPLLNGDQMRAAAVVGMQLIAERQKRE